MPEPTPEPESPPVVPDRTALWCPECGADLHIADVRAFLLALHLVNVCPETSTVVGGAA